MSELSKEEQYLKLIIYYLKNDAEIKDLNSIDELSDTDVNIFSADLFESLYHKLLLYYRLYGNKNILTEKKKYFFSEIAILLEIIYEDSPDYFFKDDFFKYVLLYLIESLKESDNMQNQTILKIFFNFKNLIIKIKSKKFDELVVEFENGIVPTVVSLMNRYESDFENNLGDLKNKKNFSYIMKYLDKDKKKLPFYLKGFLEYDNQRNSVKFLLIKMYKFFEILNPYEKLSESISHDLYQGYSLYGITSGKNILNESFMDLSDFKKTIENRITDTYAKKILEFAVKLLGKKSSYDFINCVKNENINFKAEPPKISNNFDDTKKYYQDLYEQLIYYLEQYKKSNNKICKIIIKKYLRTFWFCFCRLLLLNLKEDDIKTNEIKIIFYFIVNLFNPDVDSSSSLEFDDDAVPILFPQCPINILSYTEIYKIIDKSHSKYYRKSKETDKFVQMFINSINEKISNDSEVRNLETNGEKKKFEVDNILKYCNTLPFPLLAEYLGHSNFISNGDIYEKLIIFFEDCFADLEECDKKYFIEKIVKFRVSSQGLNIKINDIINSDSFLMLINDIMTSPVMNDAYIRISNWYLTNGKFNIEGELKSINEKENLINGQSLFEYYHQFCNLTKDMDRKSNLFIVMGLPEFFKGFTFRFLKIVLNSEGIKFKSDENENEKIILLKAYLVFVIIHEQNHYIKRFLNVNSEAKLCKTPKIGEKDEGEGGKLLITILFGDALINKSLNLEQAKYILDINNWRKENAICFKKGFLEIKTKDTKETTIIYLSSGTISICDHSKLDA